jgi:polyisoprenoid-binding protein YceI
MRRLRPAILLFSLCTFFCPLSLFADQAEVTAIVLGLKQVRKTEDVQLIRVATAAKEPLTLGARIEIGDSLKSISGKPVVELKCPNGTVYVFREKFEVVLIPPTKASCAIDVRKGSLGILADSPTEINSGGVHLGSEGTVYSVSVDHSEVSAQLRIAVFEGKVKLLGENPISQGTTFTINGKIPSLSQLNEERDVLPVAAALARVDAARARSSVDEQKIFQALVERHALVLIAPEDREVRLALARAQSQYGIQGGSAAYQLRRLGLTEKDLANDKEMRQGRPVGDESNTVSIGKALPLGTLQGNYRVDQDHSGVNFKIRHFVSNITGRFRDFDGVIKYDEQNRVFSGVEFVVRAASIDTANNDRDEDLRSKNFFEVEKYPTLTFASTRVVPSSENTLEITGYLTLHGITRKITFPVKILGTVKIPGGEKVGFEASFTISRKEFGINWNNILDSGPVLGDEVMVSIEVEANRLVRK